MIDSKFDLPGYANEKKGYRLLDIARQKIVVANYGDVIFEETVSPEKDNPETAITIRDHVPRLKLSLSTAPTVIPVCVHGKFAPRLAFLNEDGHLVRNLHIFMPVCDQDRCPCRVTRFAHTIPRCLASRLILMIVVISLAPGCLQEPVWVM